MPPAGRSELARRGLKQGNVVPRAALERAAHQRELYVVYNLHILARHKTMGLENVTQCHVRHATGPAAYHAATAKGFPVEVRFGFAAYEEGAVALGYLRHYHGMILKALIGDVYARFGPHQGDLGIAGYEGCHALVAAAARHYFHVQTFFFKIAERHRAVQRRIEYAARDLVERNVAQFAAAAAAAHERAQQHSCRKYHSCLFCNYHYSFYLRIYWLIPYYAEGRGNVKGGG